MANQTRYNEGSYGHEAYRRTRSKSQNQIRQHSVPSWEKKFCFMVGSVPWKRLIESHKHTSQFDEVVLWNDLAGKKAFHNAKSRFWAKINGLPCRISLPDPDLYIDEIHWNTKIEPELLFGLEVAPDEIENVEEENVINSFDVTLDQIKPTGWDTDYSEEVQKPKLLTGMVVGDCESSDDDKICLRECSNFQDNSQGNELQCKTKYGGLFRELETME